VQVFAGPGPAHVKLAFNRLYPGIAKRRWEGLSGQRPVRAVLFAVLCVNLRFFGQKYFPAMEFAFPNGKPPDRFSADDSY